MPTFARFRRLSVSLAFLSMALLLEPLRVQPSRPAGGRAPPGFGGRPASEGLAAQTLTPQPPPPELYGGLRFRMVGPTRGGRVTAVAGHPAHPFTFYLGATGGGVWKTENYGMTWRPVSDGFFETGSIGAIRVAPSNPEIVYVGTGSDGIRSNVIDGRGVYKSNDGGESWQFVGLREVGQIGAVEIHPTNPDVVYVAAMGKAFGPTPERGVFKTTDGGESWRKVLFTSDSVGAVDLELNPSDPEEIYAALYRAERKPWTIISGMEASGREDGIWKSTDGGESWRLLTTGLPTRLVGKIDLAVSAADPDRIYALVEALPEEEGLYRSDDRGETWTRVSSEAGLMNRPFYYTNVDADPTDADVVYVNNEDFYKSTDGGHTFVTLPTPHGDNHDMWINPENPEIFIQSNDGGANVTLDGGHTWSPQSNQATAELYSVDVDDRFPYWLYSGQQDNTTIAVPSDLPEDGSVFGPEGNWKEVGGCETGPAVPKPNDPSVVFSNCKGRFGRFSSLTGQEQQYYVWAGNLYGTNPKDLPYRFQRVAPIEVSPHDPDVVYHGSQYVHRTRDGGRTWTTISPDLTAFRPDRQVVSGGPITRDITGEEHYSVLYAIEESPLERGLIWVGANDGPVHLTRDGGETWVEVTPPMPPEGRIQNIEPSPHDPAKAYIAAYRYLLGDYEPYLFRTEDYGESWTRLTDGSNGIPPDYPTRVVREDPAVPGLLYAGTEFGLFVSFDDGGHWQSLQLNLPATPVTDIRIVRGDLALSTMGRSFWVLDDLSPLRQIARGVDATQPFLFQPADAYRLAGGMGTQPFGSAAAGEVEYAPRGAYIDYYLPGGAPGGITLQVLDEAGAVIRTIHSGGGGTPETGSGLGRTGGRPRPSPPLPSAEPGMHRFVWDLAVDGPLGPGMGPRAVPGTYHVRVAAGSWSQSRAFHLLMDPREEADGLTLDDLRSQFALDMRVGELAAQAQATLQRLNSALASGAAPEEELEALRSLLVDAEGSYPQPMLLNQIGYLLSMLRRADQKPGDFAYLRFDELRRQLAEIQTRLEEILKERPHE